MLRGERAPVQWIRMSSVSIHCLKKHGHRMVANFLRKELDDMDGPKLFLRPLDKFERGFSCEGVNEGGNATHAVPRL